MKLRYTRTGGFANITTRVELDPKKLSKQKAARIAKLLKEAKPSIETREQLKKAPLPDEQQHVLEIVEGDRVQRITKCDSECSPQLLRLFDELQREALSKK
jgi:Emfourin